MITRINTPPRTPSAMPQPRASEEMEPSTTAAADHQLVNVIGDWIGQHPVLCVGVALSLGAALGCLVKRR